MFNLCDVAIKGTEKTEQQPQDGEGPSNRSPAGPGASAGASEPSSTSGAAAAGKGAATSQGLESEHERESEARTKARQRARLADLNMLLDVILATTTEKAKKDWVSCGILQQLQQTVARLPFSLENSVVLVKVTRVLDHLPLTPDDLYAVRSAHGTFADYVRRMASTASDWEVRRRAHQLLKRYPASACSDTTLISLMNVPGNNGKSYLHSLHLPPGQVNRVMAVAGKQRQQQQAAQQQQQQQQQQAGAGPGPGPPGGGGGPPWGTSPHQGGSLGQHARLKDGAPADSPCSSGQERPGSAPGDEGSAPHLQRRRRSGFSNGPAPPEPEGQPQYMIGNRPVGRSQSGWASDGWETGPEDGEQGDGGGGFGPPGFNGHGEGPGGFGRFRGPPPGPDGGFPPPHWPPQGARGIFRHSRRSGRGREGRLSGFDIVPGGLGPGPGPAMGPGGYGPPYGPRDGEGGAGGPGLGGLPPPEPEAKRRRLGEELGGVFAGPPLGGGGAGFGVGPRGGAVPGRLPPLPGGRVVEALRTQLPPVTDLGDEDDEEVGKGGEGFGVPGVQAPAGSLGEGGLKKGPGLAGVVPVTDLLDDDEDQDDKMELDDLKSPVPLNRLHQQQQQQQEQERQGDSAAGPRAGLDGDFRTPQQGIPGTSRRAQEGPGGRAPMVTPASVEELLALGVYAYLPEAERTWVQWLPRPGGGLDGDVRLSPVVVGQLSPVREVGGSSHGQRGGGRGPRGLWGELPPGRLVGIEDWIAARGDLSLNKGTPGVSVSDLAEWELREGGNEEQQQQQGRYHRDGRQRGWGPPLPHEQQVHWQQDRERERDWDRERDRGGFRGGWEGRGPGGPRRPGLSPGREREMDRWGAPLPTNGELHGAGGGPHYARKEHGGPSPASSYGSLPPPAAAGGGDVWWGPAGGPGASPAGSHGNVPAAAAGPGGGGGAGAGPSGTTPGSGGSAGKVGVRGPAAAAGGGGGWPPGREAPRVGPGCSPGDSSQFGKGPAGGPGVGGGAGGGGWPGPNGRYHPDGPRGPWLPGGYEGEGRVGRDAPEHAVRLSYK